MKPRLILYGAENRRRLLYGTQMFAKTICVTYGPNGRNVVLDRVAGLLITKDGVTVAREVNLDDPVANMACQALKEACIKVNNDVGDGTTSAACIAATILQEGCKLVDAGYNPIHMAKGIQDAAVAAVDAIYEMAKPITTQDQLEKVALIASNGDVGVSANMAEAVMAVGKNGTVSIEDGSGVETVLVFKEGMEIDRGAASMSFLKEETGRSLDGPIVAVIAATLSTVDDVLDICEEATTFGGRPLVIFCENIRGDALKTMILNDGSTDNNFEFVAIVSPGNFDRKKDYLGDIAALAGADLVDPAQGVSWKTWDRNWFGGLRSVQVHQKKATLVAHDEASDVIQERIQGIQAQYQHTTNQFDTDRLNERLAIMEGGLCIMQIGAHTEMELKEKRARVEDALGAVQAALEGGVVPGGGTAYLAAHQAIRGRCASADEDVRVGWGIMAKALRSPLAQLATNAGEGGNHMVEKILGARGEDPSSWIGWDVLNDVFKDFGDFSIIDPTRVVVAVIEAAASSASTLMTSEASISELRR